MIELGQYAFEVLSAYGVTLGLLGLIVLLSWRRARRVRQALEKAEAVAVAKAGLDRA
ncbi:MAG: heme exporter protein CcmD [Pseudomonadota bacterium]